ncbi:cutinase [Moniliophthora roreri MCA 2997]|uniref:Cutinase n=2 Tax=Moniliophthora roreri TaxID=221103 RepID=V2XIG8_MONRO|nr:cutinase [Moniliophthora roreri MCA 2997]KAI3613067.1 cutinase [Moniliophthora roreri]
MFTSVARLVLLLGILTPAFAAPLAERAECAEVMVIFARGTTETPPIGIFVGPPFEDALVSQLGGRSLSFQGVDYAADIAGFLAGGDPAGSRQMAIDITNTANACPNARIVSSGYSQGGQLVHNSAALLSRDIAARINAVVIFGDPKRGQPISGVDSSKVKVFCHDGDNICDGGILVLPPHLNYVVNVVDAAKFVVSKL